MAAARCTSAFIVISESDVSRGREARLGCTEPLPWRMLSLKKLTADYHVTPGAPRWPTYPRIEVTSAMT